MSDLYPSTASLGKAIPLIDSSYDANSAAIKYSVRASSCRIFPRDVNAADPRLAMPRTAEPMPIASSASLLSISCAYLSSPVQQAVPDGGDAVADRDA